MIICSISEVLSVSAFSPFLSLLVDSKASVNFFLFNNYANILGINDPIIFSSLFLIFFNIFLSILKLYCLKKGGIISAGISSN